MIKFGKLNLVDLAGAENIAKSGADKSKDRSKEAGSINTSLLTLGRVINSLTENASHVPYRESKLTRLLADSLGGKTKTCIIATVSPSSSSQEETLSTLEYASRAKRIHNQPEVNQKLSQKELLNHYVKEIQTLKQNLEAARSGNGFYVSESSYNGMVEEIRISKDQILELEESLQTLQNEHKKLETLFSTTRQELEEVTQQYDESVEKQVKLHIKIDKISEIHQLNSENLNSYSKNTENTTKSFQQDLSALQEQTSRNCTALIENIGNLEQNTNNAFNKINNQISSSFQLVDKNRTEMLEMIQENVNLSDQEVSQVEQLTQQQTKMVSNLFKTYFQHTRNTFNDLVKVVQKQEETVKTDRLVSNFSNNLYLLGQNQYQDLKKST